MNIPSEDSPLWEPAVKHILKDALVPKSAPDLAGADFLRVNLLAYAHNRGYVECVGKEFRTTELGLQVIRDTAGQPSIMDGREFRQGQARVEKPYVRRKLKPGEPRLPNTGNSKPVEVDGRVQSIAKWCAEIGATRNQFDWARQSKHISSADAIRYLRSTTVVKGSGCLRKRIPKEEHGTASKDSEGSSDSSEVVT